MVRTFAKRHSFFKALAGLEQGSIEENQISSKQNISTSRVGKKLGRKKMRTPLPVRAISGD